MAHCCSHSRWFRHPQEGLLLLVGSLCFDGPLNYCSLKINDAPKKPMEFSACVFREFPYGFFSDGDFLSNSAGRFLDTFFIVCHQGFPKLGPGSHQDRLVFFIIETLFAVTFFSEVIVRCAGFRPCWVPNVLRCRKNVFFQT